MFDPSRVIQKVSSMEEGLRKKDIISTKKEDHQNRPRRILNRQMSMRREVVEGNRETPIQTSSIHTSSLICLITMTLTGDACEAEGTKTEFDETSQFRGNGRHCLFKKTTVGSRRLF